MRSAFSVDGTPINVPGVRWVTNDQRLHGIMQVEVPSVTLPGMDGELALPGHRSVGHAEWRLHVAVQGTTYREFMQNKAALEAVLSPARRMVAITEGLRDGSGSVVQTLTAYGMLTDSRIERPWQSAADGADMEYVFRIPSGVWLEPQVSASVGTFTGAVPAFVGGSAPQHDVVIEFTSSSSYANWRVTSDSDPDAWVEFDGNVGAGLLVRVDVARLVATQAGNDKSGYLNQGPRPLIIPADGRLRVTVGSGPSQLTIKSRKAWY